MTTTRSCWWCGAAATTNEHRFKRSDLVHRFGTGAWIGDREVAHVVEGREARPQSSRSGSLTYRNTLCGNCNNTRSQPFDKAYERFAVFVGAHGQQIRECQQFHWSAIFGSQWRAESANVVRFWIKVASCRLAETDIFVHPRVAGFLDGTAPNEKFHLDLEIREDIGELIDGTGFPALWIGPLEGFIHSPTGEVTGAGSFMGIDWLRINWEYAPNPTTLGKTPSNRNLVKLGSGRSIPPESMPSWE